VFSSSDLFIICILKSQKNFKMLYKRIQRLMIL
jgi:hypothetical protein